MTDLSGFWQHYADCTEELEGAYTTLRAISTAVSAGRYPNTSDGGQR